MRAHLLGALSLPLLVAAAVSAGDAAKDDGKHLQGDWTILLMEEQGKKAPEEILKEMTVRIKDDKMTLSDKGKVVVEFKIQLDSSKMPKTVDFTYLSGDDKGQKELGIYRFDGDTVKFCVNEKGKERPKAFATAADNELNLVVLKRKK